MTTRDFCYWLQGYLEITPGDPQLNAAQVKCIQNHLSLVFKHDIDPTEPGDAVENQAIHDGETWDVNTPLKSGLIARC